MQRHKRFLWTWAAAGVLAVTGLLGACDPEQTPRPGATARLDEQVTLLVGMGPSTEGFELNLEEVPLTTAPTRYTLDVSRVADRKRGGWR